MVPGLRCTNWSLEFFLFNIDVFDSTSHLSTSTQLYVEQFRAYADSQGDYDAHFDSICFEVNSYPIEGFNNLELGI